MCVAQIQAKFRLLDCPGTVKSWQRLPAFGKIQETIPTSVRVSCRVSLSCFAASAKTWRRLISVKAR